MRGGKDGSGVASLPCRAPCTERRTFPGKEKKLVPEGETTVRKAGTRLHKKGPTLAEKLSYSHEELEGVRANAKYAGLGFYGIHDDDTLRTVLNGGKYDPSKVVNPHHVIQETAANLTGKFSRIRGKRGRIRPQKQDPLVQVSGGGTIVGGEPQPQRPVLAMSNYYKFCQIYDRKEITPYYAGLRKSVFGYLQQDGVEEEDVTINAMHVMTAVMHRADSERPREEYLKEYPALFRAHMIDLFGDDKFGGFFNVHFCDPDLECKDETNFEETADFVYHAKLPCDISSIHIFDVTDTEIKKRLSDFIKNNEINLIYFIGGETHWLNRQLTKCKFKEVLEELKYVKIVFGGYSAGAINLGRSSYITASKNYVDPENDDHDDVSDLCFSDGERIPETCKPVVENIVCAPEKCGDRSIKYDTLGVSPYVYFPHFDMDYLEYLVFIEEKCESKPRPDVVLTDGMMAFTDERGFTCFIFADSAVEKVLLDNSEEFKLDTYDALTLVGDWYDKEGNSEKFGKYSDELFAYLHSCTSIPLENQMSLIADGDSTPDPDAVAGVFPFARQAGGARSSTVCGTVVGLVIAVAVAFVRR